MSTATAKRFTTIKIHAHDADAAEKIAFYLAGKSFFKFNAFPTSYPCAGNDYVNVITSYPHGTDEECKAEATEMVMALLADMATGH